MVGGRRVRPCREAHRPLPPGPVSNADPPCFYHITPPPQLNGSRSEKLGNLFQCAAFPFCAIIDAVAVRDSRFAIRYLP